MTATPSTSTAALLQPELEQLIASRDWATLRAALEELDPSDVAELIAELSAATAGVVFRTLPRARASAAFAHLSSECQEQLIEGLSGELAQSLVEEMPADDRARLFDELPAEVARRLLAGLPREKLEQTRRLLGYPPDAAGRFMTTDYVALRPDMTAAEALAYVRRIGASKETIGTVFVVDEDGRLVNDLLLGTLVLADPAAPVGGLEDRALVAADANLDREDVLVLFEKYDRTAVPVIDSLGHLLGAITVDDVLDVAEQEATEDIQKMGGVEALDEPYTSAPVLTMFRKRGSWLSVLFAGQLLTATVMERFETTLEQAFVLAAFVPLIISSGGNSGSQATSLIIRALAVREVRLRDWARVLRRELACAAMLGAWLGLLGLLRVVVWQQMGWADYTAHWPAVGATIAVALAGVVLWGSVIGSMLPFLLRRLGLDPATSSAPFVATLVDVTGLLIYFTVATATLSGRLL